MSVSICGTVLLTSSIGDTPEARFLFIKKEQKKSKKKEQKEQLHKKTGGCEYSETERCSAALHCRAKTTILDFNGC